MELYSAYLIGLGHISPMDPKFNLQTHTLGLYMKLNRNVNYLSNIPQIYRHINLAAFWAYRWLLSVVKRGKRYRIMTAEEEEKRNPH